MQIQTCSTIRTLVGLALLGSALMSSRETLSAQPASRAFPVAELPLVAEAALKGLETRVRILSRLEAKQVDLVLDSSLVPAALHANAQSALRGAVEKKGGGSTVPYRLTIRSFEQFSDSTAKATSTLETRPTGGCDTKTLVVLLVKRQKRWESNLVVDVVAPECKHPS